MRWDLLPDEMTNGVITGYRVRYRQNKDRRQTVVAVDGTQARCTLSSMSIRPSVNQNYYVALVDYVMHLDHDTLLA